MATKKYIFEGGKPTNATLDYIYAQYSKTYDTTKARLMSEGYGMYLPKKRKQELGRYFMSIANEESARGKEYKSKGAMVNSIVHKIVDESKYEYTAAQARSYQKAIKFAYGKEVKIKDLRMGIVDDVEQLKKELEEINDILKDMPIEEFKEKYPDRYKRLEPYINVGFGKMSGKDRKALFGKAYFGSI